MYFLSRSWRIYVSGLKYILPSPSPTNGFHGTNQQDLVLCHSVVKSENFTVILAMVRRWFHVNEIETTNFNFFNYISQVQEMGFPWP